MFKLLSKLHPTRLLSMAVLGISLQAMPAAASLVNVGNLAPATPYVQLMSPQSSFSDIFQFNLLAESDFSASLASLELALGPLNVFSISNLSFDLYSQLDPMVSLASGTQALGIDDLAVGNYFIRISGNANGAFGGNYLFGMTAMPVPEPEQWMLFLAGLLAVGSISRRRLG